MIISNVGILNSKSASGIVMIFICVAAMAAGAAAQFPVRTLTPMPSVVLSNGADLDQCRNGSHPNPAKCEDSGGGDSGWVNGNAGENNAHWAENQFLAYRMKFGGLSNAAGNSHTVIIGYDVLKGSTHALDYLGTFNTTAADADPCSGISFSAGTCSTASPTSTFPIPADGVTVTNQNNPNLPGQKVQQIPGEFTMWGGTITAVSYITYAGGEERQIAVTFSANVNNPVLAWGGHIAWIGQWGPGNSASAISGSPYHMRLIELDGKGGNQDRSLKNTAVTSSGGLVIIKQVTTTGGGTTSSVPFFFTASSFFTPLNFSLVDQNDTLLDRKESDAIITFGASTIITVQEDQSKFPAGGNWSFNDLSCTGLALAPVINGPMAQAMITVAANEVGQCTFKNTQLRTTAAESTVSGRVTNTFGQGIGKARVTVTDASTGAARTVMTNPFGNYIIPELESGRFYLLTVSAKGWKFADDVKSFSLYDSLTDMDFVANP